jgi:hypothetical protein
VDPGISDATLIVTLAFGSADVDGFDPPFDFELLHAAASRPAATTTAATVVLFRLAVNDFIVTPGLMDRGLIERSRM